mmetsp:Transcript_13045/g.17190  ORF Transcript_13045/g.17190 Transcript_13045/m.17190 type:complete len:249 (-) Transcript_13045:799-1545(-)
MGWKWSQNSTTSSSLRCRACSFKARLNSSYVITSPRPVWIRLKALSTRVDPSEMEFHNFSRKISSSRSMSSLFRRLFMFFVRSWASIIFCLEMLMALPLFPPATKCSAEMSAPSYNQFWNSSNDTDPLLSVSKDLNRARASVSLMVMCCSRRTWRNSSKLISPSPSRLKCWKAWRSSTTDDAALLRILSLSIWLTPIMVRLISILEVVPLVSRLPPLLSRTVAGRFPCTPSPGFPTHWSDPRSDSASE